MNDEEAMFEVWFQLQRRKDWERRYSDEQFHEDWGIGYRASMLKGWLARASVHVVAGATRAQAHECEWTEIEDGCGIYNTCKNGEEWHVLEGLEMYPHCHWCGGKIVVTSETKESGL